MFSFKFYVDTARKNSLMLRITNNRKKTELSMGLRMTPPELDAILANTSRDVASSKLVASWTLDIKALMVELAEERKQDMPSSDVVALLRERLLNKEAPKKAPANGFIAFFRDFMQTKTAKGTVEVYRNTYSKMLAFDPGIEGRSFEDINMKWLTDFEGFCAGTMSKNARNIHLRNIRTVFNRAIDYELTTAYPFRRFKVRPEETRKRSMSVGELRSLFDCPVEPYAEFYRDMFKLIFFLVGINTADLYGLKEITKDGRIEYKRAKTGRLYSIKVEPEALEIIEKYRGEKGLLCIADRWSDHRNFRHQLNKALQLIGADKNKGGRIKGGKPKKTDRTNRPKGIFEGLTSYWARHTWATIARKIGVPIDTISLALGHSSDHRITRIYIDEDPELVDEANRRVLDWVLYGKL